MQSMVFGRGSELYTKGNPPCQNHWLPIICNTKETNLKQAINSIEEVLHEIDLGNTSSGSSNVANENNYTAAQSLRPKSLNIKEKMLVVYWTGGCSVSVRSLVYVLDWSRPRTLD